MKQYLDLTTWIILFALAPLTILILLSQNSIPGDLFYPVKRGMENVVLAAASVNPSTRVAFRTDLTQKRFAEAQQLFAIKADTTAFSDFATEVSTTQQDLSSFSNQQDKIQLSEKLIAKIDEYQNQLAQAQNQVLIAQGQTPSPISPSQSFQEIQNQTPTPVQFTSAPAFSPVQVNQTPIPTQSPQSFQTSQPTQQPIQSPTVTTQPVQVTPQPTPLPSLTPNVATEIANNPQKAEEAKTAMTNAQEVLKKAKEQLRKGIDDAEVEKQVHEDQKKLREELKKRQDNGDNN